MLIAKDATSIEKSKGELAKNSKCESNERNGKIIGSVTLYTKTLALLGAPSSKEKDINIRTSIKSNSAYKNIITVRAKM